MCCLLLFSHLSPEVLFETCVAVKFVDDDDDDDDDDDFCAYKLQFWLTYIVCNMNHNAY